MAIVRNNSKVEDTAIQVDDIIILVASPAGSGKTTFIKACLGTEAAHGPTGDGRLSAKHSLEILAYPILAGKFEDFPPHRRVVLVEVPGFQMDGPDRDEDIIRTVEAWLKSKKVKATGIVYLNESDPNKYRRGDKTLQELEKWFERLLGSPRPSSQLNVVIGIVDFQQRKEDELRAHWGTLLTRAVGGQIGERQSRLVLGVNKGCSSTARSMVCQLVASLNERPASRKALGTLGRTTPDSQESNTLSGSQTTHHHDWPDTTQLKKRSGGSIRDDDEIRRKHWFTACWCCCR